MITMTRFSTALALLYITPFAAAFSPTGPILGAAPTNLFAERPRSANGQDPPRPVPAWTAADPAAAAPPSETAAAYGASYAIVDPPKRENSWTNAADKPRGPREGLSKLL
ncbi:hypothetical protein ACHAWF_007437 [Thalassiosira exigua]